MGADCWCSIFGCGTISIRRYEMIDPKLTRRWARTLLILTVVTAAIACAPAAEKADPAAELAAKFQATLDTIYEDAKASEQPFPGATAAYILPDGRVFGFATGYSDVEEGVKMSPDMRMPSGSIGKTYAAAVAISMDLDGTLSLDDKISKYLGDEDWFSRLPNGNDITLRNLLNRSSGLIDHVFASEEFQAAAKQALAEGDPDRYFTPREQVEFVLDREPLFPVGKGFSYTDTGYLLAGMVMEKASGHPYYEELKKRFLEPLHLTYTLPQDRRRVPNLAQGYAVRSAQLFGIPPKVVENGRLVFHPGSEWTGGGLYNNPQDLVRWAKALYEGNAMDGDYLDDLLGSAAETGPERSERSYSLGVGISSTPLGTAYGHSGFFPGYLSIMRYFPDYKIAVAMQMNTDADQPPDRAAPLIQVVVDGLK